MLRPNQSQTNFFSVLYDRIPEDHLLKRIANAVDFSFINELVADSYCASFGRPAKEPELMAKLCILERLYNLSDVKVIEEANCKKQVPERVMKHLAAKIFAALEADHAGKIPSSIDTNIPDYKEIQDHKEAKRTMKEYLEKTVEAAEPFAGDVTKGIIEEVKEILSDEKFILQKGLRSLVDPDARVGYKSRTDSFFGYKTEYAMTTDERIITAVDVHSGEYVDGTEFHELLEKTEDAGVKVEAVTADKAYFRKDILDELEQKKIESVIPISGIVYHIDEDLFSYNKDSDEWFCRIGNRTVKKTSKTKKKDGKPCRVFVYTFDKEGCRDCPHREECMGRASGGRRFQISENTPAYYQKSQRQKSPEFLEKYKKRAAEEWKNAEMKRFHGLARAKGWGLRSMSFQAKFTAIAVNLKRIANLIRENERKNVGCAALIFSLFPKIQLFRKLKVAA